MSTLRWLCLALLLAPTTGCVPPGGDDDDTGDDATGDDDTGDDDTGDDDTGDDDDTVDPSAPTLVANAPLAGALEVPRNTSVAATFSEPMDPDAVEAAFSLSWGEPALDVPGTLVLADAIATFWPAAHLESETTYTATVSTSAESALGVPLAAEVSWTFTTGLTLGPTLPVPLGLSGTFVVLSKAGITSVPTSAVTGDIGVSPAAATYITGFSLSVDPSNEFATSPQVTGRVYAADYAVPTPALLTTAIGDMELAFVDAGGRAPDVTELGAGNIAGMNLEPGVYTWSSGLQIPTDVTLTGSATEVWIFSIAQNLTLGSGAQVLLAGGALPENVFWQVAGAVDLGTTSHLQGVVLTQTAATLQTGASLNGRLLAQTAVDLAAATVTEPAL